MLTSPEILPYFTTSLVFYFTSLVLGIAGTAFQARAYLQKRTRTNLEFLISNVSNLVLAVLSVLRVYLSVQSQLAFILVNLIRIALIVYQTSVFAGFLKYFCSISDFWTNKKIQVLKFLIFFLTIPGFVVLGLTDLIPGNEKLGPYLSAYFSFSLLNLFFFYLFVVVTISHLVARFAGSNKKTRTDLKEYQKRLQVLYLYIALLVFLLLITIVLLWVLNQFTDRSVPLNSKIYEVFVICPIAVYRLIIPLIPWIFAAILRLQFKKEQLQSSNRPKSTKQLPRSNSDTPVKE